MATHKRPVKCPPLILQEKNYDCSVASVQMLAKYYGVEIACPRPNIHGLNCETLLRWCEDNSWNYALLNTLPSVTPFISLIYLGNEGHYVVVTKVTKRSVYYNDPWYGKIRASRKEFKSNWNLICHPSGNRNG